jgi:methylmalonyl-CoA carboxyltransferase large subunit
VELDLTNFVVTAVLVGFGCALSYAGLWLTFHQSATEQKLATTVQLQELAAAIRALEAKVATLGQAAPPRPEAAPAVEALVAAPAVKEAVALKEETVTPEILVVIAAAVTAFLGKKVRIRSAKMLQSPYEIVNPWSQQGRVFVQASHNLRLRG